MSFLLLLILFGSIKDICEGCETGYFSDSNQCQRCPSNCTSCSSALSCTSCSVGNYGILCSYACSNYCHENECDRISGICLSCIKGYYRDVNKKCVQCPQNCTTCNSHHFCFACKSGYTGTVCEDVCRKCKPFTNCDKNSGYCFDSCSEGFSGELCDMECNSTCKSCERLNSHECTSCADGANGSPCREECFYRCLKNTCSGNDMACKYGCSSGYWGGEKCNQTCLTYCKNSFCNITCNETVASKLSSSSRTEACTVLFVGLVIGSTVMIIVLCITVWIIVRKYRSKHGNCCYGSSEKIYSQQGTPQPDDDTKENDTENEETSFIDHPKDKHTGNVTKQETAKDRALKQEQNRVDMGNKGSSVTHTQKENKQDDESTALETSEANRSFKIISVKGDQTTEEYIAAFGQPEIPAEYFHEVLRNFFIHDCDKVVILTSSQEAENQELENCFCVGREQYESLTVVCQSNMSFEKYRVSTLHISTCKPPLKERDVKLFHFFDWPNNGIPSNVQTFLDFHTAANNDRTTKSITAVFSSAVNSVATYIAFDMFKYKHDKRKGKNDKNVNEIAIRRTLDYLKGEGLPANYEQVVQLAVSAKIFQAKTYKE